MKDRKFLIAWAAGAVLTWPVFSSADTIYLCKAYAGGTFWTNGTCASKSAHIDRIANVPGGMTFDQQVSIAQGQRVEAAGQTSHTTTTVTNTITHSSPQLGTKAVCDGLSAQVSNYDSMARQPQSGQTQDWITGERKKVRDQQFALRC